MIRFKFKKDNVELPENWDEVTVEVFINPYFLSGDPLRLLSSLSGIDTKMLLNTTEDLMPHFNSVAKFINESPEGWRGGDVPESIEVLGVNCTIPKNIELERFGQKILLGQALSAAEYPLSVIPRAIAIYLSPQIYPDNWDDKIEEVEKAVRKLSITSIYPIADFFLPSISTYRKGGKPH